MPGAIILDSFNRADNAASLGNADTGETWIPQPRQLGAGNSWLGVGAASVDGILANRAYTTVPITEPATGSSAWNRQTQTIDHGYADVDASVDVILPFNRGSQCGLILRHDSAGNYWGAGLYRSIVGAGYGLYLELITGGGTSRAFVDSPIVLGDGATGAHRIRAVAIGGRWRTWFNGAIVSNVASSGLTSTYVGATDHGITISGTSCRLDNYRGAPASGWIIGRAPVGAVNPLGWQ